MKILRRWLLLAALPAFLVGAPAARADGAGSWDGTWSGMLGKTKPWPITVTISDGKVVAFTENGTPFDVEFSKVTPTRVIFGDKTHYSMKIEKTGDFTAAGKLHGRHGVHVASLTKG